MRPRLGCAAARRRRRAPSFGLLLLALVAAGAFGGSVNAAATRAVLSWLPTRERGLALGIRQTAIPLGGASCAVVLPPMIATTGSRGAFLLLSAVILVAALATAVCVRASPSQGSPTLPQDTRALGNRRVWRFCTSSGVMLVGQSSIVGFVVLFLHERHGLTTGAAAAVLAACQVTGALVLLVAGRASDRLNRRIGPLRALGYAGVVALAAVAVSAGASLQILGPLMVIAAAVSFRWVALASADTGESVPAAQSGVATGLQQAMMAVSATVTPLVFAAVVMAARWRAGFAVAAAGPLLGAITLEGLAESRRA